MSMTEDLSTRVESIWNNVMSDKLGAPPHYTDIAVLILHWAASLDEDLRTHTEVTPLANMLGQGFGFTVEVVELDNKLREPQLQLDEAVDDFVRRHDGHTDSHLLIVYYTGHGVVQRNQPHTLIISGYESPVNPDSQHGMSAAQEFEAAQGSSSKEFFTPACSWSQAEIALDAATADTLVILDCCFAGNVVGEKSTIPSKRSYELMVATGKDMTATRPGPRSYTHALIDALSSLKRELKVFSTADLSQRISKLRKYHDPPRLYNRLHGTARHIRIAPPAHRTRSPSTNKARSNNRLDLRVTIDQESLSEADLIKLARELSKLPMSTGLAICGIECLDYVPSTLVSSSEPEVENQKNDGDPQ
ncbi:hypothetical protein LTR15_002013 [Elasticomyces elasticus]|nr:hypothetical protein LTR15_002013 [Elasticomyces elasticus]